MELEEGGRRLPSRPAERIVFQSGGRESPARKETGAGGAQALPISSLLRGHEVEAGGEVHEIAHFLVVAGAGKGLLQLPASGLYQHRSRKPLCGDPALYGYRRRDAERLYQCMLDDLLVNFTIIQLCDQEFIK